MRLRPECALTLPSSGQLPAGFARLQLPLMSNVRRLARLHPSLYGLCSSCASSSCLATHGAGHSSAGERRTTEAPRLARRCFAWLSSRPGGGFVLALVPSGALARKLEEFAWLSMVQLFRLLGAGLVPARFANALPSGRECVVQRICPWLTKGSRGKLALMARNQALLHQPPNPSIERTPSGMLRMPTVAAHVQR